ncbi:MAG: hypothetical protein QOJ40_802 [Verrucomicrobiota bacterium]
MPKQNIACVKISGRRAFPRVIKMKDRRMCFGQAYPGVAVRWASSADEMPVYLATAWARERT